jgi:hypothetical protein
VALLIDDSSKRQHNSAMLVARELVRSRAWLDDAARLAYGRCHS